MGLVSPRSLIYGASMGFGIKTLRGGQTDPRVEYRHLGGRRADLPTPLMLPVSLVLILIEKDHQSTWLSQETPSFQFVQKMEKSLVLRRAIFIACTKMKKKQKQRQRQKKNDNL